SNCGLLIIVLVVVVNNMANSRKAQRFLALFALCVKIAFHYLVDPYRKFKAHIGMRLKLPSFSERISDNFSQSPI
ncbi:MAG: hypothetical protein KDE31_10175, partial [Caldilineaceae bacterium]|nr:hypothetical protein [Caldilineaceae bacterium]